MYNYVISFILGEMSNSPPNLLNCIHFMNLVLDRVHVQVVYNSNNLLYLIL